MAYTATVIKQSVEKAAGSNDYIVMIHVVIEDETPEVVFEKDYSERYNSSTSIGDIKTEFQNRIQADWDKHVAEKTIYDAAAFDTMVSQIQSAANTYINQ